MPKKKPKSQEFLPPAFIQRFEVVPSPQPMFYERDPLLQAALSDSFSGAWVHREKE